MPETDDLPQKNDTQRWKRICVALTLLVLVRGVFVLSVLPPFEGWDEYQHIAYIVYLKEQKALPPYGLATVPQSMVPMLQNYPHSGFDHWQNRQWETRTYDTFWTQPQVQRGKYSQIQLYQAQQGPLYYLVALPFWLVFSSFGPLAGIYALRLLNALFLTAAVFIFLQTLAKCVPKLRHRIIIGLLVATYPLYLITAARISNCALSIFFGSLTLYFTIRAIKEKPLRFLMAASCCLGLGILAKATMLTMIPVVLIAAVVVACRQGFNFKLALKTVGMCLAVILLFLVPLFYRNYKSSGMLYVMSQHRDLQLSGKSSLAVFPYFFKVGWSTHLRHWIFTRDLWVSGWSFIYPPGWFDYPYKGFMYLFWMIVIAFGLKRGWSRKVPQKAPEHLFTDNWSLLIFGSVVSFMVAGLAYFATISLVDLGVAVTIPSYFMIALPAWTALLYQAALFVGTRFAFWSAQVLMAFYVVSELFGTLVIMPKAFTNTSWSWLSWTRLTEVHPFFPSPWFIIPCLLMIAGLLGFLIREQFRNEPVSPAQ